MKKWIIAFFLGLLLAVGINTSLIAVKGEEITFVNNSLIEPRIISMWEIEGEILWKDDDSVTHPFRYGKIEIVNFYTNEVLDTGTTDGDGRYSFIGTQAGATVFLRIYAEGETIIVVSPTDEGYIYESDSIAIDPSLSLNPIREPVEFNVTITMDTLAGKAMQIAQAAIMGERYVKAMNGAYPSDVTIEFPHNNEEKSQNCFYEPILSRINIANNYDRWDGVGNHEIWYAVKSYASWDIILHEYGHHIQKQLSLARSPGGEHSFQQNLVEEYGKLDGIRLAWGEAHASVLGELVQQYYKEELVGVAYTADAAYTKAYYKTYMIYESSYTKGEGNEYSIAGFLWDLFDGESEGNQEEFDTISMSHLDFWNLLKDGQPHSMSGFVNYYYETHTNRQIDAFAKLLSANGFSVTDLSMSEPTVNFPPTFTWTSILTAEDSNGIKYYHEKFQFVFYNENFNGIYNTEKIDLGISGNTRVEGQYSYTFSMYEWGEIQKRLSGYYYRVAIISWQEEGIGNEENAYPTGGYIAPTILREMPKSLTTANNHRILTGSNSEQFSTDGFVETRYMLSGVDTVTCTVDYTGVLADIGLLNSELKNCFVVLQGQRRSNASCYVYIGDNTNGEWFEMTPINGNYFIDIKYLYDTYGTTTFTLKQTEYNVVLVDVIIDQITIEYQKKL